jgi:hypothetical protein
MSSDDQIHYSGPAIDESPEPREEIAGHGFEEVISFFWASSRSMLPCNMAPSTA